MKRPSRSSAARDQSGPPASAPRGRFSGPVLLYLIAIWLGLILLAIAVAQRVAVTGPARMSLPRAGFFVTNAASLTGLEMTWATPASITPAHGAIWIFVTSLTALLSTAIAVAAFAQVSGLDWSWRRTLATSAASLAILWLVASAGELTAGEGVLAAAWNGVMVVTATGLLSGAEPGPASPVLWLSRFPIAALASIAPLVVVDLLGRRARPPARVSRLTWTALPVAFVLAVAIVTAAQALSGGPLVAAATAAIDAQGAGFADTSEALSPAARWSLVPVLLLGGASGGIGGGLKALTAAVLLLGLLRMLRAGGGAGRTFAIAASWLVALVLLFGLTFVLLAHTSPQLRPDRAAVIAAAACGGAGLSIDPVSFAGADAYVVAVAMLLGRVLPWAVLWLSARWGDEAVAVG